jgi:hypothetical protein
MAEIDLYEDGGQKERNAFSKQLEIIPHNCIY